jgi:3-oxoacid CoA-transferase B subunit
MQIGIIGGAMDLVMGAKRVIIAMNHLMKKGEYRIVNRCTYPLTARECVDLIIADIAVILVMDKKLVLKETAPGWSPEEIQDLTEPKLIIDPDCQKLSLI